MYEYQNYREALKKAKELGLNVSDSGTIFKPDGTTFFVCWNENGDPAEKPIVYVECAYGLQ